MKKSCILLFASLFTLHASLAQQYGWTDISANIPGTPDLSDVFFVSDDEGWISVSSGPEIYHTTDGGETFEIQTNQFSTALEAIYMIDENEGFTGGGSGFVYRTTDGGENWNFHGTIPSTLSDMDFASSTQGYACGDNGAVFSITPQGVTNLNSGLNSNLSGISSPSVDKVWICGNGTISHYNGTTFEFQSGPVGSYNAIFFIDDNEGWVMGNSGLIGHTENKGENWHRQTNPDPDRHSLYDLFFLDENNGWAVGSLGTIIHTIDGGETWELQAQGLTTNFLRGVYFTSLTNGYAVGNGKTLLKYTEVSGIEDFKETIEFEISPNPCRDKIQISKFKNQTNSKLKTQNPKLEILDLNGRVVYEERMGSGEEGKITMDVSRLPAGLYLVKLQTEDRFGLKKFIKK